MASRIRIEKTDPTYRGTAAAGAEYAVINRIHWGAIFAGALIAVAVSFALNLLGFGIGLSTINPTTEAQPFQGLGTGAIIWYVVANLIALFTGGYVAGRLAGFPKETTAGLHGVLSWALFTVVSLYLINSAVGRVFNTVGATLSAVSTTAGDAVAAVVPDELGKQIQQELRERNINLGTIRNEAYALLEDTDKAALDPDNLAQDIDQSVSAAQSGAADAAQSPYAASREINEVLDRIGQQGDQVVNAADQDALVNILTNRTDLSETEARRTVAGWAQQYEETMVTVDQKINELGDTAANVGEDVADGLATASILGFLALLAGAGAAFFGGVTGRQRDLAVATTADGAAIRTTEA